MKRLLKITVAGIAVLVLTAFGLYQLTGVQAQSMGPGDTLGPEIGAQVNTFTLKDRYGSPRDFASLKGEKGLVLAFTRSAAWCPFCQMQMKDISATLVKPLKERGSGIAGVSYDSVAILRDFTERHDIRYPLLSDEGTELIRAWELTNTKVDKGPRYGYPHPIIMIIDADGTLRAKLFEQSYRDRPTTEAVLEAVDEL